MTDLVSIIVPVYNIECYLSRCIDSILAQTYQNFELILVDDGSSDGSSEICDICVKKDNRIKVIHKANAGVSQARNDGIQAARGVYLSFIDGDDWIENNYIECLVNAIHANHADAAAVGFKKVYEDGANKEMSLCETDEVLSGADALNQAMDPVKPWVGYAWGKMVRRTIVTENCVLFDPDISICEDSLFNYSVFQYVDKVVKIPGELYNYYIRSNSATRLASQNYASLRTKITAFEKAAFIAENYRGGVFCTRVNNALFDAIISYLTAMFRNKKFDNREVLKLKEKLSRVRKTVDFSKLSNGIKVRYFCFKINPKLLFLIESKRG